MHELAIPPAVEAQLLALHEMAQDGNEHLAHMRGDKTLKIAHGSSGEVTFGDRDYLETQIEPGDWCLHTHPSLASFSNGDLYLIAQHGLYMRGALITADKSIYTASPNVDDSFPLEIMWDIGYRALEKHVVKELIAAGASVTADAFSHCHDCSIEQIRMEMNASHFINLWLAKQGLIDYNFRLGPDTKPIYDRLEAAVTGRAANRKARM